MVIKRTFEGWEARLRPGGWGRVFEVPFLLLWLCAWAIGEVFALVMLGAGAWSLLTGEPIAGGPRSTAGALVIGGFLFVWLSIWTVGGLAASHELLRVLWGEDRLIARPDGLRIVRRAGPLRRERFLPRADLLRIYRPLDRGPLMAETRRSAVELLNPAEPAALARLETELTQVLRLETSRKPHPPELPEGWLELAAPEGGTVLTPCPHARRIGARFLAGIALVVALAGGLVAGDAGDPQAQPAAAVFALVALMAGLAAAWLAAVRKEWKIEPGRLRLQRRIGSRLQPLFEGRRLEMTENRDGDGDVWHALVVSAAEPGWSHEPAGRPRRVVLQRMNDPWEPTRIGRWMAERAGVALQERKPGAPA